MFKRLVAIAGSLVTALAGLAATASLAQASTAAGGLPSRHRAVS